MPLSSLSGIPYFQSGVGADDDLKVQVREDLDGGWFPVLRSGYYYLGADEGYLYAQRVTHQIDVAAAGATGLHLLDEAERDPTRYGPVRIERTADGERLQRVCSPLRAFQELSWTPSGDFLQATVAGTVISLVSHPTTGVYLQVPASGDIISTEDYVYDPRTGTVTIQDPDPPALYATYLVPESVGDQLKQQEIVRVDRDGKLRTQFSPIYNAATTVVRKPTPAGPVVVSGVASVSGNVITLASGSTIEPGDLVAVEYYLEDSFFCRWDEASGQLRVELFPGASGAHLVHYEGGEQYYDTARLPPLHQNRLQLNPLLQRLEPCFLYLCDADLPGPVPDRLELRPSEQNPVWSPYLPEPVLVQVRVLDSHGEPCAAQWVELTVELGGADLYTGTQETDWTGRALFQFAPNRAGTAVMTAVVRGTSVTGSTSLTVHDLAQLTTADELALGKLLLHLEALPYRDGLYRLNAHYVELDGAPFQPSDPTPRPQAWRGPVVFSTRRSMLYTLDGEKLGTEGTVKLDVDSVASVLIRPEPGDLLRAEVHYGGRRRVARPVRVPQASGLDPQAEPGE